jgi:hypothetical protein
MHINALLYKIEFSIVSTLTSPSLKLRRAKPSHFSLLTSHLAFAEASAGEAFSLSHLLTSDVSTSRPAFAKASAGEACHFSVK